MSDITKILNVKPIVYIIGIVHENMVIDHPQLDESHICNLLTIILSKTLDKRCIVVHKRGTVDEILSYVEDTNSKLLCIASHLILNSTITEKYPVLNIIYDTEYTSDGYVDPSSLLIRYIGKIIPNKSYDLKPNDLNDVFNSIDNDISNYIDINYDVNKHDKKRITLELIKENLDKCKEFKKLGICNTATETEYVVGLVSNGEHDIESKSETTYLKNLIHYIAEKTLNKTSTIVYKNDDIISLLKYVDDDTNRSLLCVITDTDIDTTLVDKQTILKIGSDGLPLLKSKYIKDLRNVPGLLIPNKNYSLEPTNIVNLVDSIYNSHMHYIWLLNRSYTLEERYNDSK